jgi:hypothetical protein
MLPEIDHFGLCNREGEDRFRSLTDLKWGEFESIGFNHLGDEKKLQFDLTESARTVCLHSICLPFLNFFWSCRNARLSARLCPGTISLPTVSLEQMLH